MENSPQTLESPVNGESGFPSADDDTKSERTAETKKRRKLTGMPDPDAEVIALSPKTLLATNRFVCEICNKGFQRDQNLQLHRRGHNLPWTLRSRTNKEARKRVYVCPEPTCVHHDPSRALGDLTGIKKHFCRKHGEKKYECSRCFKKYAVPSDWKAHMKTCGTREYRCDCGTLFSRRDSFITHRAFCDALAQETARSQSMAITSSGGDTKVQGDGLPPPPPPPSASSPPPPPLTPSTCVLSPVLSVQSSAELPENQTAHLRPPPQQRRAALSNSTTANAAATHATTATTTSPAAASSTSTCGGCVQGSSGVFASVFGASTPAELPQSSYQPARFSGLLQAMAGPDRPAIDPISLSLASSLHRASTLFPTASEYPQQQYASGPQPALSATALLQKAAQMGATSSNSSFLCSLGLAVPSPCDPQDNASTMASNQSHWNHNGEKLENNSLASGLGLGPPSGGSSGYNELMMDPSGLFGNKPTTLDFLGLGMGGGEASSGGISAFLTSMGVRASFAGVSSARDTWDDPSDRKPSML